MKALLDRQHIAPGRAHARLAQNLANGWASCPLTESGCLRVLTNPRHVAPVPATDVLTKLATAKTGGHYEFWADDLTITDAQVFDRGKWRGHQQVTDAYNDGNLESDSLWTYTWDGENRLIQMQSQSNVSTNDRRKLTFEYDWQSRRIRKKVYEWDD